MSDPVVTIEDAASRLGEIVDRVHGNGEAVVIVRGGEPVVRIVPVGLPGGRSRDLISVLRVWRENHPEPDDQFAEVIEESRRAIRPPRDPWA